jgi:putative ABC transport system substrate-binding protein
MRRREFITLLGGSAATWPLAAHAQQRKMRRVGALLLGNADAEAFQGEMREGLFKAGYVEGQNILFDFRSAQGRPDLLPELAAELVALKVDVLVALQPLCARGATSDP